MILGSKPVGICNSRSRAGRAKKGNRLCVVAMPEPHRTPKPSGKAPAAGSSTPGAAWITSPMGRARPIKRMPSPKQCIASLIIASEQRWAISLSGMSLFGSTVSSE